MIVLLYKAQPDGCQHRFTNPAETKAPPHEGASSLKALSAYDSLLAMCGQPEQKKGEIGVMCTNTSIQSDPSVLLIM